MKYLNTKPGSIEEIVANMSKHQNESGYQDMFKKELEKAGKGIGAMTPAEKKAFFNKIDDKYKAKNEDVKEAVDNPYAVGMSQAMKSTGDKPPLKKSTITKAHDIAKSIEKDKKNEEKDVPKGYHKMPDGTIMKDSEHKKETHTFMTKDMNKSKKDAKGEKEIVDPEPKLKQESMLDAVKNVWQLSAEQLEKIKSEAKYMKAQRMDKYKGKADTGSDETKVELEPSVDYKN